MVAGATAGGGGGHGGGGHGGGHAGGGYHGGGYGGGGHYGNGGYTHHHQGYYYPGNSGFFFPGFYLGGYGYGYGYGSGYQNYYYPSNYGYGYSTPSSTYVPYYVDPASGATYANPGTYTYSTVPATVTQGVYLGIDEEAVVDPEGPGMQVLRVYPGSAAERGIAGRRRHSLGEWIPDPGARQPHLDHQHAGPERGAEPEPPPGQ